MHKIRFVAALFCALAVKSNASAEVVFSAAPAQTFTFTRNMTLSVRGDDVSALQRFLIAGGFLKIPSPTGMFGSFTKDALGAWQVSVGIHPPNGFFGNVSRDKMNADVRRAASDTIPVQKTLATTTAIMRTKSTPGLNVVNGLPVRLTIPGINVDAGFQYTGLKTDGTMEIPTTIADVGWFTGSVRPGQRGTAIITGHVAQIRKSIVTKQGVFYNLNELRVGDKLSILNDKGESIAFTVRETRRYDPAADATRVFASVDNGIHLNLITCEGVWNQAKLSYTERLVVFTDATE